MINLMDDTSVENLHQDLTSGKLVKREKHGYTESQLYSFLGDFFRDTIFLLFVTIFSSLSIGFAYNIKTQGLRSDGNKVKVEYMKKHLVFVNYFNYIWILFLANSYFMMAYFMHLIETHADDKDEIATSGNSI